MTGPSTGLTVHYAYCPCDSAGIASLNERAATDYQLQPRIRIMTDEIDQQSGHPGAPGDGEAICWASSGGAALTRAIEERAVWCWAPERNHDVQVAISVVAALYVDARKTP